MTKDEALKLALEALEEAWYHVGTFQPTEKAIDLYDEARTAIKEALAQPEQEPVAWMNDMGTHIDLNVSGRGTPLYTTTPQRKPLSDEEIETYRHMIDWTAHWSYIKFARAIEAAHGIKGEA